MHTMGIDVGGTNLRVGLMDSMGNLVLSFKEPTPTKSIEEFLEVLIHLVEKVQDQSPQKLLGLGIGWPGTVDHQKGIILETPNIPGFQQFPLKQVLEERLQMNCRIDNDAKCAALAEQRFGAAQGLRDFLLLTFGTGIGGAIFCNGQLMRGKSGLAGEIGHFCLHPQGIECTCGSRGCFERYCSALALERRALQKFQKPFTAREVLAESSTSSEFRSLIAEYVEDLALALGSLVNIFDPEAIIFSGGLFTAGGGPILSELKERLSRQGYQSMKKGLLLLPSALEGKAGIVGAASLVAP